MSKAHDAHRPRTSAVALSYDGNQASPRIVAKGYGILAETIVRTAKNNGLYVHESPELVNLLMQVDLDAHIPPSLYLVIAELLTWLYHLDQGESAQTVSPADTF